VLAPAWAQWAACLDPCPDQVVPELVLVLAQEPVLALVVCPLVCHLAWEVCQE